VGYDVRLEKIEEARPLAVVRRRARSEQFARVVPECCGVVWKALKENDVKGAGRHVAVYLDDVVNLEVGVEMESEFGGCGEVVGSELPKGLIAGTVHLGPYQRLGEAHAALKAWCVRNEYALAGPKWEIYEHWLEEWNNDPSKIRTDVFYLVRDGEGSGVAREPRKEDPSASAGGEAAWKRFEEPIGTTLLRTFFIALIAGAVSAWLWGRGRYWPLATLLMLWFALGGHWVEVFFLNVLRPRLPVGRAVQVGVRVGVWFIGGVVLGMGMKWTAVMMGAGWAARWMTWWMGGLGFIGVELVVHLVMWMRALRNFYEGTG
jgi:effector-binding domain-containing protein